jgi:hypothetical protein
MASAPPSARATAARVAEIGAAVAAGLTERIRRLPLGILLLAALSAILGLGSTLGGLYLVIEGGATIWAVAVAILAGPTLLYLAYHLMRLAHWTWLALMVLAGLLFASSVVRIAVAPRVPLPALAEIIVQAAVAFYLVRPRIRSRFGWGPPPDSTPSRPS